MRISDTFMSYLSFLSLSCLVWRYIFVLDFFNYAWLCWNIYSRPVYLCWNLIYRYKMMIVSHNSDPLSFYCYVNSKTGKRKWFGSCWLNSENDRWRSRGVFHTPKAVDSTRGEEGRAEHVVRWGENYTPAGSRKGLVRIFKWQD